MPNWVTDTRGQNRADEQGYYDSTDHDALSCADYEGLGLFGHGIRDVEDLTLLSGIRAYEDGEEG